MGLAEEALRTLEEIKKWKVLSRLEDLGYADCKSVSAYSDKITGILQEAKYLDITMDDLVEFKIEKYVYEHPELPDSRYWVQKYVRASMHLDTNAQKSESLID